ncbi:Uncharacterised protein [Mycobacteroides abscessus subsp. abscessus]|nr:Uncharacterised protein [Mycobacteroides abscessus subsp. abscessus]
MGPAGEVEDAHHSPGKRVTDRSARARQTIQRAEIVFAAADEGGPPGLGCRADAIGSDELLGVAVAAGQLHRIEGVADRPVGGHAIEDDAVRRGEDDAHRLVREHVGQLMDDRCRRGDQRGIEVRLTHEGQIHPVRMDAQVSTASPGVPDGAGDQVLVDQARTQKPVTCPEKLRAGVVFACHRSTSHTIGDHTVARVCVTHVSI